MVSYSTVFWFSLYFNRFSASRTLIFGAYTRCVKQSWRTKMILWEQERRSFITAHQRNPAHPSWRQTLTAVSLAKMVIMVFKGSFILNIDHPKIWIVTIYGWQIYSQSWYLYFFVFDYRTHCRNCYLKCKNVCLFIYSFISS